MSMLSWEEYDNEFHLSEILTRAARTCVSSYTTLPETFFASYFTERVNKDAVEWIRCITNFAPSGLCLQFTIHLYVNVEFTITTLPIHFPESVLTFDSITNVNDNNNDSNDNNNISSSKSDMSSKVDKKSMKEKEREGKHKRKEEDEQQIQMLKDKSASKNVKRNNGTDNAFKLRNGVQSVDLLQLKHNEVNTLLKYEEVFTIFTKYVENELLPELLKIKVSAQHEWDAVLSNAFFIPYSSDMKISQQDQGSIIKNNTDNAIVENKNVNCTIHDKMHIPVEVERVLSMMAMQAAAQSRSLPLYEYVFDMRWKLIQNVLVQSETGSTYNNSNNKHTESEAESTCNEEQRQKASLPIKLPYLLIPFFGAYVCESENTRVNNEDVYCTKKSKNEVIKSNNDCNKNYNNTTFLNTPSNITNSNSSNTSHHANKGNVYFETLYIVVSPNVSQECKTVKESHCSHVITYKFMTNLQRAVEEFKQRYGNVEQREDGAMLYCNFENITDAISAAAEILEACDIHTGQEVTFGVGINCTVLELSQQHHINNEAKGRKKDIKLNNEDRKRNTAKSNLNKEKIHESKVKEENNSNYEELQENKEREAQLVNNDINKTVNVELETESYQHLEQEECYYELFPNEMEVSGMQLTEYLIDQVERSEGLLKVIINSHATKDKNAMCRLMRKVGNKVRLVNTMETNSLNPKE